MLSEDPTETPSQDQLAFLVDCITADPVSESYETLPSFSGLHLAPGVPHEALMAVAVSLRCLDSAHPPKLHSYCKKHRGR